MKSRMFRLPSWAVGLLCVAGIPACATSPDPPHVGQGSGAAFTAGALEGGVMVGYGGSDVGNGGGPSGTGGGTDATGGTSSGTGGSIVANGGSAGSGGVIVSSGGSFGTGGVGTGSGGASGSGGACFLGICPATGGTAGTGGAQPTTDAGAHKAMCNQKLCVDPIFDCLLQGCGDAVCQIPFCVIK